MAENWTKELPNGWQGGEAITKWWRGSILHLYRLRKACRQCSAEMVIDVTAAALNGDAKNAGLLLQRCQNCRAASKGGTSRPRTDVPAASAALPTQAILQGVDPAEHAQVKAERDEYAEGVAEQMARCGVLQRKHDALFVEIQVLKAKLATFLLQPAMEAQQNAKPTFDPHALLTADIAAKNRMPWEG